MGSCLSAGARRCVCMLMVCLLQLPARSARPARAARSTAAARRPRPPREARPTPRCTMTTTRRPPPGRVRPPRPSVPDPHSLRIRLRREMTIPILEKKKRKKN